MAERNVWNIFGWEQSTLGGAINSQIGGATQWVATATPDKTENKAAQNNGALVTPAEVPSTPKLLSTPTDSTLPQSKNDAIMDSLDNIKQPTYQLEGLDFTGKDFNVKVQDYSTPYLNDPAIMAIQQGIPASKKAGSGYGLPKDLVLSGNDLNQGLQLINTYLPKLAEKDPNLATLYVQDLTQKQQAYKQAMQSGDNVAQAEALALIKGSVASASAALANHLYSQDQAGLLSDDWRKDMSILYGLKSKWEEFNTYYQNSWQDLQKYLQNAITPQINTFEAKASELPSLTAKKDMIANPYYLQFVQTFGSQNPQLQQALLSDMNKPGITYWEKQFLKAIKPTIQQYQQQKYDIVEKYGWTTANNMFKDFEPMFDLLDYGSKTYMDDLMEQIGTWIQSSAQPLFWGFSSSLLW